MQDELTKQNKNYITLCPTNLAALLVGGMTIHKFAAKLKKQAQIHSLDLDYIFVDEVSMLGEVFYKFLMMIKQHRPNIKFIISGDHNQLKEMQQTERSGGWCKVLESTGAGLAEEDKHAQ